MSDTNKPNIQIPVDLTNPGQFFACCGLLELADRLWPGAEGWFEGESFLLATAGSLRAMLTHLILDPPAALSHICERLPVKPIIAPLALTFDGDASESFVLDCWVKVVTKSGRLQAVAAPPWNMWSGNQKSLPIWLQLRDELRLILVGDGKAKVRACAEDELRRLFQLTRPLTGRFGFDSTAAWNALDVGFSPNDQGVAVESSPAVELLAAIGLQRFRPMNVEGSLAFQVWHDPLPTSVAAAYMSGVIPHAGERYRFSVVDRGQYSAFGKSRLLKGDTDNVQVK